MLPRRLRKISVPVTTLDSAIADDSRLFVRPFSNLIFKVMSLRRSRAASGCLVTSITFWLKLFSKRFIEVSLSLGR